MSQPVDPIFPESENLVFFTALNVDGLRWEPFTRL
jgi:hypothetical protein